MFKHAGKGVFIVLAGAAEQTDHTGGGMHAGINPHPRLSRPRLAVNQQACV